MVNYTVFLSPGADRDLDSIYSYIANELVAVDAAENLIDEIEKTVLSLDIFPHRGGKRTIGPFANRGYRQIHVENFTIVYRINEKLKQVIVITIRYSPSQF